MTTSTSEHKTVKVVEFTCERCETTSRWTEGLATKLPPNWVRVNGLCYCLACRRERAIEEAIVEAGEVPISERAKLRTAAIVRFEIDRDPDRTEGEIAKAARTSIGAVRKIRSTRRAG